MGAWLLQGEPKLALLNLIDNTIYYLCMPIACYFFWRYLRVFFRVKNRATAVVEKIMFVGMSRVNYREYELQLKPGSKLFVYTD